MKGNFGKCNVDDIDNEKGGGEERMMTIVEEERGESCGGRD